MSGKPINSEQVKVDMTARKEGKIQVTAGAKAGMSERSGRRIERGELQPGSKRKRYWRTRTDTFATVWESEVVPLLKKKPKLTPITLGSSRISVKNFPVHYGLGGTTTDISVKSL